MNPGDFAGIALDGRQVTLVRVRGKRNTRKVLGHFTLNTGSRFYAHDLRRARQLVHGLRRGFFVLPDHQWILKACPMPEAAARDPAAYGAENLRAHNLDPDTLVWDLLVCHEENHLKAWVCALRRDQWLEVRRLARHLRLQPSLVTAYSFSFRAILKTEKTLPASWFAGVQFDPSRVSVAIWKAHLPVHFASLPLPPDQGAAPPPVYGPWLLEQEREVTGGEGQIVWRALEVPESPSVATPEVTAVSLTAALRGQLLTTAAHKLAYGAALLAMDGDEGVPNCVPRNERDQQKSVSLPTLLRVAVLLGCAVILFLSFRYMGFSADMERESIALRWNHQHIQPLLARKAVRHAEAQRRLDWERSRTVPLEIMALFSRVLPARAHLETLHLKGPGLVTLSGFITEMEEYLKLLRAVRQSSEVQSIRLLNQEMRSGGLVHFRWEMEIK